jgi:hypothetical protein
MKKPPKFGDSTILSRNGDEDKFSMGKAINREIIAANYYNLLIQYAPSQYIQTILGIIRDEL